MKLLTKFLISAAPVFLCAPSFAGGTDSVFGEYMPEAGVIARIRVSKASIGIEVETDAGANRDEIPLQIERSPRLTMADYNFDGRKDFSIRYLEEGMGTYFISRVFLYNTLTKSFKEVGPRCGDEFLNLKIDVASKALISMYYKSGRPKLCKTRLKE